MCFLPLLMGGACASPASNDRSEDAPPRPESEILPAHLAYLDHMARADASLAAADFPAAIAAAEEARRQPVQVWYDLEKFFGESPAPHGAAHFTLAQAKASTDPEAAMGHLLDAARAGYSDKSRVESEPLLESLRQRGDWPGVLATFRDEEATDDLAGRTVESLADGMRVVKDRARNHPKLGEQAPDFEADLADGSGVLRLSELYREKPVVLVFGSFT